MTSWYEIENAEEIPSPNLLVYVDRIESNLKTMIAWTNDAQRLRPHVKTHKMPNIVAMKLKAGITKFKASTIAEVEMTADAGGKDILLAYQPIGPHVDRLVQIALKYPDLKLATVVDNSASLEALSKAAVGADVTLHIYVDLNIGMDRTGIAIGPEAFELYQSIADLPGVEPGGLHAYDGHLHQSNYDELCELADKAFQPVWDFRDELLGKGLPVPTIAAAGTPTSKLLTSEANVEVGAGTPVLWDSGYTAMCPQHEFKTAAVLLARVISRPAANLICIDLGYKAVASESAPPRVYFFGLEDATPIGHSEEHLVLETDRADEYPVGTVLYGIPHHVCPTVALYQEAWCVRSGRADERWPVVARDRRVTI